MAGDRGGTRPAPPPCTVRARSALVARRRTRRGASRWSRPTLARLRDRAPSSSQARPAAASRPPRAAVVASSGEARAEPVVLCRPQGYQGQRGFALSPARGGFSREVRGRGCRTWFSAQLKGAGSTLVEEGAAFGAAGRRDGLDGRGPSFSVCRDAGVAAAALDREVADAVAGVDHVVAAVAEEDVLAGLAEHRVGAAVADQDVVVEGALHVLVGRREVDVVAAGDRVDPGGVLGEGDDRAGRVGRVSAKEASSRPPPPTSAPPAQPPPAASRSPSGPP